MKWEEIKRQFKDEWVLVGVEEVDDAYNLVQGQILAHSKDKDKIYQELLKVKPTKFSIEYTGEIPDDLSVVLAGIK